MYISQPAKTIYSQNSYILLTQSRFKILDVYWFIFSLFLPRCLSPMIPRRWLRSQSLLTWKGKHYWYCQHPAQKLIQKMKRIANIGMILTKLAKAGIFSTVALSHPWELMLLLCCLFSTSTTSATGLNVIPAEAGGGTGRDGVAGARPFRADT